MKLTDRIYLVGSGAFGFDLTHNLDCHVYLVNGGDELAIVDSGIGLAVEETLRNVEAEGFSIDKIKYLLLTHVHADHAGGAARMKQLLGCDVLVSKDFSIRPVSTLYNPSAIKVKETITGINMSFLISPFSTIGFFSISG